MTLRAGLLLLAILWPVGAAFGERASFSSGRSRPVRDRAGGANLAGDLDFSLAVFGDQQTATSCVNPPEAWLHLRDAVEWTANEASPGFKFAIQLGDVTDNGGNGQYLDCECLARAPDPTCADVVSAAHPGGCPYCGNPWATACEGGVPGPTCEWERARNAFATLEAAGIPWVVLPGNHDRDRGSPTVLSWFNRYFGPDHFTSNALATDAFVEGDPDAPTGITSYQLFEGAGVNWLHIALPWAASSAALDWAEAVILAHPRVPTIISTHNMMSHYRMLPGQEPALYACANVGWCEQGTGQQVFSRLSKYPQVFLNLGGHAVGTYHETAVHPAGGHEVTGALIDYSFTFAQPGTPGWVRSSNGGGGIVVVMRFRVTAGRVEVESYSPREDAFVDTPDGRWGFDVDFCDASRFDLAAACEVGAGGVSDAPLTLDRRADGNLALSWGGSSQATDTSYEVYEGVVGSFRSHVPRLCSTGGARSTVLNPSEGNRYYLVVPRNRNWEGSYGRTSAGVERERGKSACAPQAIRRGP